MSRFEVTVTIQSDDRCVTVRHGNDFDPKRSLADCLTDLANVQGGLWLEPIAKAAWRANQEARS